ncbi:hypothetical protein H4R19_004245, partial [Coemansia spiralis]
CYGQTPYAAPQPLVAGDGGYPQPAGHVDHAQPPPPPEPDMPPPPPPDDPPPPPPSSPPPPPPDE